MHAFKKKMQIYNKETGANHYTTSSPSEAILVLFMQSQVYS